MRVAKNTEHIVIDLERLHPQETLLQLPTLRRIFDKDYGLVALR